MNLSQGKARVGFGRSSNIFLNHPSVSEALWKRHCVHFQVLQPSGYNGKKEYTTTWKSLQAQMPKDNTEHIYTAILSSFRSPTACLLLCFTLLPQREINYSKARKIGYVRAPNDIQIASTLASSQTSHLTVKAGCVCVGGVIYPVKIIWRYLFSSLSRCISLPNYVMHYA